MSNSILSNLTALLSEPIALIVYAVFISQISIISFYLPSKWRRFRKALFKEHPESEYPKLYYQPFEVELGRQTLRRRLDYAIAALSVGTLIFTLVYSTSLEQTTELMFMLCVLQLLPFILSQYWGAKNSKLMQKMPQPQKRKVTLISRKLTDFIRPSSLLVAIVIYITSITLGLFLYWDTIISSQSLFDTKSWILLALLLMNTLVVIYVLILLNKTLFAKREDQHLSHQDRLFFIKKKISRLVNSVILFSLFILTLFIFRMSELDILVVYLLTSIYTQVIMLVQVNPTKERDFSVYKADEAID